MAKPEILADVTEALGVPLVYDRGPEGYGVPVYGPERRFYGAPELDKTLQAVGADLETTGWRPYIESILTGGVYVNKPGPHGKGIAIDFDGVVLESDLHPNYDEFIIAMYKSSLPVEEINSHCERISLPRKIATRFANLLSLHFGLVLTEGYNKRHEDHIHADLTEPVMWRGSKSQVVLLQETLNAWYGTGLKVDGVLGDKTRFAWGDEFYEYPNIGEEKERWFAWLKAVAFNPPEVT